MNGTYLYGNPIVDNNATYLVIEDDYIFFYEEFKPIQKFEINYRDNNIIKINSKKLQLTLVKVVSEENELYVVLNTIDKINNLNSFRFNKISDISSFINIKSNNY